MFLLSVLRLPFLLLCSASSVQCWLERLRLSTITSITLYAQASDCPSGGRKELSREGAVVRADRPFILYWLPGCCADRPFISSSRALAEAEECERKSEKSGKMKRGKEWDLHMRLGC